MRDLSRGRMSRSHDRELVIVVISKDDPAGLRRTVESINTQAYQEFSIVVVTKGSSAEGAEDLLVRSSDVHVRQVGRGISDALNVGLAYATAEWVTFLNGGDVYSRPDVLVEAVKRFNGDASLVTGLARDKVTGNVFPRNSMVRAQRADVVAHQATFFRRRLFDVHGLYSSEFAIRMDFEWMLRLPADATVDWTHRCWVEFAGGGVSSMRPIAACGEEWRALRLHGGSWRRLAELLLLYAPYRLLRAMGRRAGRLWAEVGRPNESR